MMTPKDTPRDGEGERAAERRGGRGSSPVLRRPEVYQARHARREMSLPEVLLWQRLKGSPQGISFRKQHPIGSYRADFYCAALKLVIEVDGIAHDMGDRPQRDERRTEALQQQGYQVIRVPAVNIFRDPDEAAEGVIAFARSSPGRGGGPAKPVEGAPHPAVRVAHPLHRPDGPGPLPASGEDQDA